MMVMTMKVLHLRLPADVHERVEQLAAAERRSVTSQAIMLIEAALRRREELLRDVPEELRA